MSDDASVRQNRDKASALRKAGQFVEALALYEVLWRDHRGECNEWDGWGYAFALRKLQRPQEALAICREVHQVKPDFPQVRDLLGWCLYDLEFAKHTDDQIAANEGAFFKAAGEIIRITTPGQFSANGRIVLRVVDYLKSRPNYPAERILEWLDQIKPEQLGTETGTGTDSKGRPMEFASDREKWYADRSKALLEARNFQECVELCGQALAAFTKFHYDNDVWFRWRMALAKDELGEKATAAKELQGLLARKRDWFIQNRISQILFELGKADEAMAFALDAALGPGDLEYKWELFLLMGRLLQAQGKTDQARQHVLLALKLHKEHEWKVKAELANVVQELEVDSEVAGSAASLERELSDHWKSLKKAGQPQLEGVIKNLVATGKSGFIRADDGTEYYFRLGSFQGPMHLAQAGQRVRFLVEKNPEAGKKDIAVFIEAVRN